MIQSIKQTNTHTYIYRLLYTLVPAMANFISDKNTFWNTKLNSKQMITQSIICNGYPINIVDVVYKEIGTKLDFPNMSITNNQL